MHTLPVEQWKSWSFGQGAKFSSDKYSLVLMPMIPTEKSINKTAILLNIARVVYWTRGIRDTFDTRSHLERWKEDNGFFTFIFWTKCSRKFLIIEMFATLLIYETNHTQSLLVIEGRRKIYLIITVNQLTCYHKTFNDRGSVHALTKMERRFAGHTPNKIKVIYNNEPNKQLNML